MIFTFNYIFFSKKSIINRWRKHTFTCREDQFSEETHYFTHLSIKYTDFNFNICYFIQGHIPDALKRTQRIFLQQATVQKFTSDRICQSGRTVSTNDGLQDFSPRKLLNLSNFGLHEQICISHKSKHPKQTSKRLHIFYRKKITPGIMSRLFIQATKVLIAISMLVNCEYTRCKIQLIFLSLLFLKPPMLHCIMYMKPTEISVVFCKVLPRKTIHNTKLQVLRWFPMALTLIYKPIINLLLIQSRRCGQCYLIRFLDH